MKNIHKNKKTAIIFIPGYKNDSNCTVFEKIIKENRKFKLFSIHYNIKNTVGSFFTSKEIIANIIIDINKFIKYSVFDQYYLIGYSLGAALAMEITAKKLIKCNKLILLSIFDNRKDLLKDKGIHLPNNENLVPYNSIKKIPNTPIVFMHGMFDKSVNIKRGLRVFKNSNNKSKFVFLPTDHYFNDSYSKKVFSKNINSLF